MEELKRYYGTKEVKAAPMDEATAIEKGYARKNVDGHKLRKGYLVQYPKGEYGTYDIWLPENVFEETFIISESVMDRLQVEYNELRERCSKLDKFMAKPHEEVIQKIGAVQFAYLLYQRKVMNDYLDILDDRYFELRTRNKKWNS